MQRRQLKHKFFTNRAFSLVRAGDSLNPGVYTEDAKAFTSVESLVSLELRIHELAENGNRQGLRDALYLYLRLRGVL